MKQAEDIETRAGAQANVKDPGPLFRVGGLLGTQRFEPVTKDVLKLDQNDRLALVSDYNIPTHGPALTVGINVLEGVPPLQITVASFDPTVGDVLSRSWTSSDGQKKTVELPALAAKDVVEAGHRFDKHIRDNAIGWASKQGGSISIVASLAEKSNADLPYASLFSNCAALLFCAAHKTGSASLDPSSTDQEVLDQSHIIDEPGYPLRGKASMPRMILYQLDSVLTLQTCCYFQERFLADLDTLRQQPGDVRQARQHYFIVLVALCSNSTSIFKDQRRRAVDNQLRSGYSDSQSVREIQRELTSLICRFRRWETMKREESAQEANAAPDPAIVKYYEDVARSNLGLGEENIETLGWWLQKFPV